MSFLESLRAGLVGALCVAALLVAGPAEAGDAPPCDGSGFPVGGASECTDGNGNYVTVDSGDTVNDELDSGLGIPSIFIVFFVLVVLIGIGTTAWRVRTARDLARRSGMDPGVATEMTLLDENGLSATHLASSLRTPQATGTSAPVPPSAATRLAELKGLLDSGLVTQAEYDERRQGIIDSI